MNFEFNLLKENNNCLLSVSINNKEIIERVNKDHDNPYRTTAPKLQELVRSFLAVVEREDKETNWEGIKIQCKNMLR